MGSRAEVFFFAVLDIVAKIGCGYVTYKLIEKG